MSTTYTQTIEFSVWKEHSCASCRTSYRYLFKRKMNGEGATPEKAAQNAEKAVVNALEHEVDMQPCPGCGLYQPDMIAARRSTGHWWTFAAYLPIAGLLLILMLTDLMSMSTAAMLSALCAVPIVVAHAIVDFNDPNRNLEANRKLAKRKAKHGDLWVPDDSKPTEDLREVGNGITGGHYACYAMLAAAVLAFLLPVGVRVVTGMKVNPDLHPEVAGPGDSPYVYFKDSIKSVKGYWSGTPRVTVLNPGDLGGPVAINATSQQDSWGNSISVSSKSPTTSSKTLWARLQLPNDPNLVGKSIQVKIDLQVQYPNLMGDKQWSHANGTFSHTTTLQMSRAGAGGMFKGAFWLGFLGGNLLLFLAGGLLPSFSNRFKAKARKTKIFVPEGQGEVDEVDEVEEAEAQPRRRGRREVEEDEDERPRQRIRREEDDRPRRRRDEEEDDRPRRRRRDDDDY